MQVTSREYKVILDGSFFADRDVALRNLRADLGDLAQSADLEVAGEFDVEDPKERTILFLDTPDCTLRQNGLLLRQRVKPKNGKTEYTLKYRTEDRYVAAGQDLRPGPGLKHEAKFEEDIGVPFVSRFSHSSTVSLDEEGRYAGANLPPTLSAAGHLFPGLLALRRDGMACAPQTTLTPVNALHVFERVFTGPVLHLQPESDPATVAVILWHKGKKGRLLTAEFSFRYEDEKEAFSAADAAAARRFFEGVQRMDWARPEALTKTQYMYGSGGR